MNEKTISLADLRRKAGKDQYEQANAMGVSRVAVSNRENRPVGHQQVGGLLDYVYALGGHLQLWVVLNGERYRLKVDEEG
jgi:hypothetical protein